MTHRPDKEKEESQKEQPKDEEEENLLEVMKKALLSKDHYKKLEELET
jgi:hypothetical protein